MASAMVQVNVRIPPELHTRLMAEVAKQQTTATAVVTEALSKFLKGAA
jgi:predicted HicB family RNase H-like nuclease